MLITIGLIIVAIIIWFTIDYHLGRKNHLSKSKYKKYPERKSEIELFIDGEYLYEDLFEKIKNSAHSIHVIFYIIKNDKVSEDFLSLLGDKASQGIEVRLLLDYVGGLKLKKQKIKALKAKGVQFAKSHKPRFPYLFYTLQARNHRKITVIDGKTAYLGGFNIAREYIGKNPKFGYWRDYHLKITGEGVNDLQEQFFKDWFDATGEDYREDPRYFPEQPSGKYKQQIISTYGEHLKDHFISFIRQAQKEIIICTPYFIPGKEIQDELLNVLANGVKVKIMVPMKEDHPLVKEASFPYLGQLILAGCDVYRFYHGFYHSKVIVIDDHLCDIGTANFDKRSLYLNDEVNCLIYDQGFIDHVKTLIYEDFRRCELLTYASYKKRPLLQRGKEVFATFVSHFL
jgi:cardiolipin synthase A/B